MTITLPSLNQVKISIENYIYNQVLFAGNYTDKYWKTREIYTKLAKERHFPKIHIPEPPKVESAAHYGVIKIIDYLSFEDLLSKITPIESNEPKHMELINIGHNYGQNFGFIVYRISTNKFKHLKITGKTSVTSFTQTIIKSIFRWSF